jgi:hypothetical protein
LDTGVSGIAKCNSRGNRLTLLLRYFIALCLMRATPQQLPASTALLWLVVTAYWVVGVMLVVNAPLGLPAAMGASALDILLLLAVLRIALQVTGRPARFHQAATALMGSAFLFGLAALPLLSVGVDERGQAMPGITIVQLLLVVWSLMVMGHILGHTFDISRGRALGIAVLYSLLSYTVVMSLFTAG